MMAIQSFPLSTSGDPGQAATMLELRGEVSLGGV